MSHTPRPPFWHRLSRGVVVVTICLSLGLQWAALQGIAWTTMLISYSKDGSLVEAVTKTFDGEHPCALCHAVEDGRTKQTPDAETKSSGKKMDALLTVVPVVIPPWGERLSYGIWNPRPIARAAAVMEKPPRAEAA